VRVGLRYDHNVNIQSLAFAGRLFGTIRLSNNVTFYSPVSFLSPTGMSENVFTGSQAHTIYLPYSMTELSNNMFQSMQNLTAIRFWDSATEWNLYNSTGLNIESITNVL